MWTDGQTDTMNLTVVFCHLAEAPNNLGYVYNDFTEVTLYFYERLISYFHHVRSYLPWILKSFFQCLSNRFRANVYEVQLHSKSK